jgi:hypothetical protein
MDFPGVSGGRTVSEAKSNELVTALAGVMGLTIDPETRDRLMAGALAPIAGSI